MKRLTNLGIIKLSIPVLILVTILNSFPALGYSSGNTTIIETGRKSSYSLLDRKFIFDQAENKASQSFKKSQELNSQNLTLFSQVNLKPVKQRETKVSPPPKVIIQAKRDSLKNSETTNNLSKWDKFKESNSEITSTDEALNVNARILIKE
ncbi:MAG: hypothetical protein KGO93_06290 [Cyanobacteria bacterium REEB446]|nr:hypothetical protein [Cyanobacteria bacterium REEB446]